jgi:hypothetical protein
MELVFQNNIALNIAMNFKNPPKWRVFNFPFAPNPKNSDPY